MKRRAFGTLVGLELGLAWTGRASAQAPSGAHRSPLAANQLVERIGERYAGTRTFRARFEERSAWYQRRPDVGTVTFARPNHMSWRYANGNRVVSDGRYVQIFEKNQKQLWRQPAEATLFSLALAFLGGPAAFAESFGFGLLEPKRAPFDNGYVLRAAPLSESAAWSRADFYVHALTYDVRRALLTDQQGNRTVVDFQRIAENERVGAEEFRLTPPPRTVLLPSPA